MTKVQTSTDVPVNQTGSYGNERLFPNGLHWYDEILLQVDRHFHWVDGQHLLVDLPAAIIYQNKLLTKLDSVSIMNLYVRV